MITEFTMKPKAQNDRPKYLLIIAAIGFVAFMILYFAVPNFKGVVGLVAVGFLCFGLYIYTRYMASEYFYDILVENNTPLFVVRQKAGTRETTLARIELRHIVRIEELDKSALKEHKTPEGYLKYYYNPTMSPERLVLVTAISRYEKAEIFIEAERDYIVTLNEYAKIARELYPDED